MSAPKNLPLALLFAWHLLSTWFTTPRARASAILWRVAEPFPFIGVWLSPELFVAFTPEAPQHVAALEQLMASHGFTAPIEPPVLPATLRDIIGALTPRGNQYTADLAAVGTFAESLPAVVTHARLPRNLGARAVDATALRSLACGPYSDSVEVHRAVLREASGGAMGGALMFLAPTWRALLRSYDPATLEQPAVQMHSRDLPVALVCSKCGTTGGHHETCADQSKAARRRRWIETESDEGIVFVCRRCIDAETPEDDQ